MSEDKREFVTVGEGDSKHAIPVDYMEKHYKSYNDFILEFSGNIEEVPNDYEIKDINEVIKDLGITEKSPRVIETPIENIELRVDRVEHIVNGGGDGHEPDESRYKCINKMLSTLERPNVIVEYKNGNKGYFKVFQGTNKKKNQIVVIHKDKKGNFVYTAMPADKGSKYFINQINKGKIIYKNKKAARVIKNNSAVNNIIPHINKKVTINSLFVKECNMKAENRIDLNIDNKGKGRRFESRFLQAGLVKYSFGVCLLSKEVIDRFAYKFVGCPVIIDHKDITDENAKDERVGVISKVWFNEFDGWFWCEGVVFDDEAISLIKDKGYNVSCQYNIDDYTENTANSLHNGNPYNITILDGTPEHLAIVKNPRYEEALIAVNKGEDMKAENTEFRTGYDSEGEAYVYPIDGADDKEDKNKKNKKVSKEYKENTSHYGKKEHEEEIISLYEGLQNPNKSESRKEEDKELLKYHLKELSKYPDTSDKFFSQ